MHLMNDLPLVISHVGKGLVAKNSSVVDENINAAIGIDGGFDDCLSVYHIGLVTNSLSTELLDFLYDGVWVDKIVDDNLRAEFGEEESICATKSTPVS